MKNLLEEIHAPSYHYIKYAEKSNSENGHENLGFLSFERGFMPLKNPTERLPETYTVWEDIAKDLPFHYKNQSLRATLHSMPIIDASEKNLDDIYLCRASMLMSILAHAYVRNERQEDHNIPDAITIPWETITKRLHRPKPFLSYIDLIIYNWKIKNDKKPFEVENLELLIPTVNNQEENVFYLTQTEIAFKTRTCLQIIVDIQSSILQNRKQNVIKGLLELKKIVDHITEESFLKINPNPRSKTYVDPVVWAKTVAPFAVPLKEGVQGPSGTSSPFFHLIDTFIERAKYDTILGKEALFIREWYPEHWRNFLNEVDKVSILEYIKKSNDAELDGAFHSLIESYSGDSGFLGVHKRKVYGYLQMAFKVGRSVTIGGFSGLFKERTWEEVDDELETTRLERYASKKLKCPYGYVSSKKTIGKNAVKNIKLDVRKKGIMYRPGDRCAIVPKNSKYIVENLIKLMDLSGNETITLNPIWKNYFQEYYNNSTTTISVTDLLLSAKLNTVQNVLDQCSHLAHALKIEDTTKPMTLEEFILSCKKNNVNLAQFLLPNLINFLIPEQERMYSISSGFDEQNIELTVGNMETKINNKTYKGVSSDFLHSSETDNKSAIPFKIIRPLRFSLPKNYKNKPIMLFAGGTGIAPFKGFWEEIRKEKQLANLSIFYSAKFEADIVFKEDLEQLFLEEGVDLNIILTRDDLILDKRSSILKKQLVFIPNNGNKIDKVLLQEGTNQTLYNALKSSTNGGASGYFYVCGRAGFAKCILDQMQIILKLHSENDNLNPKEQFYSLFSENRYMQDIFSSPDVISKNEFNSYYLSDIIMRNTDEKGYWTVVSNKVYDLTEFKEIHPGGVKLILDNAGRDATHEFKRAKHHKSGEIMSMLSMYCIGDIKPVTFSDIKIKESYTKWIEALHLCSEMYNTLFNDFSFKDKKITAHEKAADKTLFKRALLAENNKRFMEEYAKNILQIIHEFYSEHKQYDETVHLFNDLIHTEAIVDIKSKEYNTHIFENTWDALSTTELANKNIILEFRKMLWGGLKIYESYEPELESIFKISMDSLLGIYADELKFIKQKYFATKLETVLQE